MDYIGNVIIANISAHASTVVANWTISEYMTWMALLLTMTVMVYVNKKAYWYIGLSLFFTNIDFSDYMESAFNKTFSKALESGQYLYVDESTNQWLGSDMANIKKVPRKPHPIGQEFETLADNHTYCIL
ncbi:hypothetical protein K7432_015699 [Basidiobolus ranarum]|uniref:Uncharacterized protein n=1 Tax=Basidiobolus ranarum TaxID=34480 RepID=A0ABR2VMW6_9FUNG